jgi:hypothetical protein
MDLSIIGRSLIMMAIVVGIIGVVLLFAPRIPFLGQMPGDFVWGSGNVKVFFPLATSIILSLILTLIMNLLFMRR